ncbi:B-4DMT family transporter [Rhodococcus sp. HNM0569]|uniref:B-4DMT family transporter n=1 Tax=Rhodococcus sp. HNM0569 TaxID=2716340 RepID=UPI00146A9F0E|nr:B-4DMT family transporter [Rhodococcus sp. HNM0569]NLU81265.1 B-4DMT family transporter [Rhodococcus sp. HNM0569]
MNAWVVRGLGMALIHVVVRTVLGMAVLQWPLHGSGMRMFALVVVLAAAAVWGWRDARGDRAANPDPEHGADLTMRWLAAAVLGGVVAGLACWILDLLPGLHVTQNGLFFEITSGAAFTILAIFVPAVVAIAVTRILLTRAARKRGDLPTHMHTAADETQDTEYVDSDYLMTHYSDEQRPELARAGVTQHAADADSDAETTRFEALPPHGDHDGTRWSDPDGR